MYLDTLDYLSWLESSLGPDSSGFKFASEAYAAHSNLRVYEGPDKVIKLCSADFNSYVDTVDFSYRSDSGGSLLVYPFLYSKEGRVYSDPPYFIVGSRNETGFGVFPLPDWKKHLQDWQISDTIIDKVRQYIGSHAPVSYESP